MPGLQFGPAGIPSTVKNAGQIVVLDNGKIVEKGRHDELINNKGNYYNLVRNQLELGT